MNDHETCARCRREVNIDDDEFIDGEPIGEQWVCGSCVTPEELQALDDDFMAVGEALADAGLGPDADLDAMGGEEYEMREGLAGVLYEHDREETG